MYTAQYGANICGTLGAPAYRSRAIYDYLFISLYFVSIANMDAALGILISMANNCGWLFLSIANVAAAFRLFTSDELDDVCLNCLA